MSTNMNATTAERITVLDFLAPAANTSARNTAWIKADKWRLLRLLFLAGPSTAAGTLRVRRASDDSGTGAENASATIAWGGTSTTGDDEITTFDIDPLVYATDAKPYLGVQISATAGSTSAAVLEGWAHRYLPGDLDNADDVNIESAPDVA